MNAARKNRPPEGLLVNLSACKYPLVREAAERLGYKVSEDEGDMWDLFWSDLSVSAERVQRLLPFQRLNHFPGMLEICRKAALSKHMARLQRQLPDEYRFYPPSLVLPEQLDELMAALRRNKARAEAAQAGAAAGAAGGSAAGAAGGGAAGGGGGGGGGGGVVTYILKPSAGTQGRGIHLVQFPHQLAEAGDVSTCVAQAYVASPLLLDGFKFDLRVYALVEAVDPLRIHLFDQGLARLATEPYQPPHPANLRHATMHLTNYAVNKAAAGFVPADAAPAGGGSKRPMSAVLAGVAAAQGTSEEALRGAIADVITKTVMAIQPLLAHTYHTAVSSTAQPPKACNCASLDHLADSADPTAPCACPPSLCFELLGFDIMFDTQLQPWLLEVNHSPSFAADSRLDRAVKGEMLARAMLMLDQRPDAKRLHAEAEARAQAERLYHHPAYAPVTAAAVGAGVRGALSAAPKSRNLQATAAALEALEAHSEALLASGARVWGSGSTSSGASSATSASAVWAGGRSGHDGAARGLARRALSFSGGGAGGGGDSEGEGGGGRFRLIFPTASDAQRKRYNRILQTSTALYPQQRCQCAWCTRRRDLALLTMSGTQLLGLASRPMSGRAPGYAAAAVSSVPPSTASSAAVSAAVSVPAASVGGTGGATGAGAGEARQDTGFGSGAGAGYGAGAGAGAGASPPARTSSLGHLPPRPSSALGASVGGGVVGFSASWRSRTGSARRSRPSSGHAGGWAAGGGSSGARAEESCEGEGEDEDQDARPRSQAGAAVAPQPRPSRPASRGHGRPPRPHSYSAASSAVAALAGGCGSARRSMSDDAPRDPPRPSPVPGMPPPPSAFVGGGSAGIGGYGSSSGYGGSTGYGGSGGASGGGAGGCGGGAASAPWRRSSSLLDSSSVVAAIASRPASGGSSDGSNACAGSHGSSHGSHNGNGNGNGSYGGYNGYGNYADASRPLEPSTHRSPQPQHPSQRASSARARQSWSQPESASAGAGGYYAGGRYSGGGNGGGSGSGNERHRQSFDKAQRPGSGTFGSGGGGGASGDPDMLRRSYSLTELDTSMYGGAAGAGTGHGGGGSQRASGAAAHGPGSGHTAPRSPRRGRSGSARPRVPSARAEAPAAASSILRSPRTAYSNTHLAQGGYGAGSTAKAGSGVSGADVETMLSRLRSATAMSSRYVPLYVPRGTGQSVGWGG
ncbi:hypothetical protein HYH03_017239 [Edaphochlamys debaryana]|uniref:Tubulin-tyrosine ligase n=1 Tax=Edaphochlamys debaryana TaxID=47281 RepID=A0A835XH03_9CHLO|nr:hypothetical protein HYH03_017239 [Edaphochlamys debaryana]|eukprot:KAG2483918.1 hypothetical protein HYH03_017239 [Edaphochlamys debaryana]